MIRLELPIVAAPMAGGPSTPALAAAVSDAGGLGFLAAGYKTPEALAGELRALRELTGTPFGVNVFVPSPDSADPDALASYVRRLEAEARERGVELGEPRYDDDHWQAKLDLLAEERVPVVSFAFGLPGREVVDRLHAAGTEVWVTVTSPEEAVLAERGGADGVIAQGIEAGGHRGGFSDDDGSGEYGLLTLLRLCARSTGLPLIAAGGIADGPGLAAALTAGATAAQLGTAFLGCPEAGTHPVHRAALGSDRDTAVTRAFTGRRARALVNDFLREHSSAAPSAYPQVHYLTAPLRAAAREQGDVEGVHLWAGQGHALADERPAAEVVARLAEAAGR